MTIPTVTVEALAPGSLTERFALEFGGQVAHRAWVAAQEAAGATIHPSQADWSKLSEVEQWVYTHVAMGTVAVLLDFHFAQRAGLPIDLAQLLNDYFTERNEGPQ